MAFNKYIDKYGQTYYADQPLEAGGTDIAGRVTYKPPVVKAPPPSPVNDGLDGGGSSLLARDSGSGGESNTSEGSWIKDSKWGNIGGKGSGLGRGWVDDETWQSDADRQDIENFRPRDVPPDGEGSTRPSGSGAYVYSTTNGWEYVPTQFDSPRSWWDANTAQTKNNFNNDLTQFKTDFSNLMSGNGRTIIDRNAPTETTLNYDRTPVEDPSNNNSLDYGYDIPNEFQVSGDVAGSLRDNLDSTERADLSNYYADQAYNEQWGMADGGPVERLSSDSKRPPNPDTADDLPRNLSEGEFVIPKNVVHYYGTKHFEDLIENVNNPTKISLLAKPDMFSDDEYGMADGGQVQASPGELIQQATRKYIEAAQLTGDVDQEIQAKQLATDHLLRTIGEARPGENAAALASRYIINEMKMLGLNYLDGTSGRKTTGNIFNVSPNRASKLSDGKPGYQPATNGQIKQPTNPNQVPQGRWI